MDDWLGQLLSTGCGATAALAALACASLHKSLPDFLEPGQHLGVQAVVADKAIWCSSLPPNFINLLQKVTVTQILAEGVILVEASFLSSYAQVLVGNPVFRLSQADHCLQSDS